MLPGLVVTKARITVACGEVGVCCDDVGKVGDFTRRSDEASVGAAVGVARVAVVALFASIEAGISALWNVIDGDNKNIDEGGLIAVRDLGRGRGDGGDKGAAKILGLNPTTLEARMKKLGIQRDSRTT